MTLTAPPALPELAKFSADIGNDPLLIQASGGNTSIKAGDVMWIKASGLQLADARSKDIFVPVDWRRMRDALLDDPGRADQPAEFTSIPHPLRPSIETSLHAIFEQPVVIHVHCVSTIAQAVLRDGETLLAQWLDGRDWLFQTYARPGAQLAQSVLQKLSPATDIVVLGNHGLLIAAPNVAEAQTLLSAVVDAIGITVPAGNPPNFADLRANAPQGYAPFAPDHPLHTVALDDQMFAAATGGSLYPDHVIFLGIGAAGADEFAALPATAWDAPPLILVKGQGALMRRDLSTAGQALARCLGDVVRRIPRDGTVNYLTLTENAELLNWDAEKYRQQLNAQ